MADYSFLRLKTDFGQAKSDMMVDSEYFFNWGICLHPLETYLQTTNSDTSIAFNESYKVELINCKGDVLKDITSKVYIHEFQDNNGIYQISYEILPIQEDFFFERLYLKITHTTSDLVLYSNGFYLTAERERETFRLDYKSYREYKGTNYVLADYYQSIRLFGYYNGISEKKDSKVYIEINGKIRKSRVIQSFEYTFDIDYIDTFVYERLAVALESDLVYINGIKAKVLETLSAGERIVKTNSFDATFKTQLINDETYLDTFQIAPVFNYTNLNPIGAYTLATIPTIGTATFNYDLLSANCSLYNYDTDVLIANLTISITDNEFSFNMPILANGNYYFLFNAVSSYGDGLNLTDKDIWSFSILDGEFDNTEFDNNEFLVN